MATTSMDSVWSLGSTRIMVPIGVTVALFMQPFPGQLSTTLKYSSGGTCEIFGAGITTTSIGVNLSTTLSTGALASLVGFGYALSAAEVLQINGPAAYYLSSTGATSIIHALFFKGQGT